MMNPKCCENFHYFYCTLQLTDLVSLDAIVVKFKGFEKVKNNS